MQKFFRSFKVRLFIVIFTICFISSLFIASRIVSSYESKIVEVKTTEAIDEMSSLAEYISNENYFAKGKAGRTQFVDERLYSLASVYNGRVLVMNSNFRIVYDSADSASSAVGKYFSSKEILQCYNSGPTSIIDKEGQLLEIAVPIKLNSQLEANGENVQGILFANIKLTDVYETGAYLAKTARNIELLIALIVAILAIIFSFILAYPFSKVTGQIKNFAAFDEGVIDTTGYVETEDIAIAFNELKVRLKVLDDSRQEFVSNVSHELKTPITSIKVLADSINEQEDVPNELYREFMQDIVDEIDRENTIITDLLSLVKLDKGDAALNISKVNVNEMLELIMKRLYPIADKNEVELILDADQVTAEIDDVKMTLALTNLIENGIKYNVPGGWVNIILEASNQYMTITIQDSGIGIAEEELGHIFERFYRVDKSHSREIGGTGLGLAIARKTILLHRGSIKVDSEVGAGTTFIVRIPLTYVKA